MEENMQEFMEIASMQYGYFVIAFLLAIIATLLLDNMGKQSDWKIITLRGVKKFCFFRGRKVEPKNGICRVPYIMQIINYIYMLIYLIIAILDTFIYPNIDIVWINLYGIYVYVGIYFVLLMVCLHNPYCMRYVPPEERIEQTSDETQNIQNPKE